MVAGAGSAKRAVEEKLMERRVVILTEGLSNVHSAKTGVSFIRYRGEQVVAVLDSTATAKTTGELFGVGGDIPVIKSLDQAQGANTLMIGIAPSGGRMPEAMRAATLEAIRKGWLIESGMHAFLCDDEEFAREAKVSGATLRDVRKNNEKDVTHRKEINPKCLRIHTVGNDCSVGKMVTSIEVTNGLKERSVDAKFVATGQTGILIEGDGCPIDCVVADFVNGAAEKLVLANQHHEVIVVEGQGCISHPRYSAVTQGLLHGVMPHGLIFCYEAGRTHVKGMDDIPLIAIADLMKLYHLSANTQFSSQFIGVGINSRNLTDEEYEREKERIKNEFALPAVDVIREGAGPLVKAVSRLMYSVAPPA